MVTAAETMAREGMTVFVQRSQNSWICIHIMRFCLVSFKSVVAKIIGYDRTAVFN